jgi:Tfp pilus assembly protein PilP
MPKNIEIMNQKAAVWRADLSNDKPKAVTECPLSEDVIAYALEELESGANSDIEDHLATCRVCADLAQDVRSAADESQHQGNQPFEVLPALTRAINRSKKPSLLKRPQLLIPNFSKPSLFPQIAGAVATACLAFIIVQFALRGTGHLETYQNGVEHAPSVHKETVSPEKAGHDTKDFKKQANEPYSINPITDNEQQPLNPFKPLFGNDTSASSVKKRKAEGVPRTPLETLDIGQLKLVGIILSDHGNTAMVEDAAGKGYVLKEGTYVGGNSGKVSLILKDKVIIEEKMKDIYGKIHIAEKELKLNKVD